MKRLINYFKMCGILIILSGCTYSINMVHTEGSASDVVDETQANTPNVSPTVSIPPGIRI